MTERRSGGGREAAERRHVVTCFLMRAGRVLLLRRSRRVGTYQGLWAGVSGYIEEGEMPLERAFREILEETGLLEENLRLIRGGERVVVPAGAAHPARVVFIVHPFLFEVRSGRVRLDWEHTEHRWVRPGELGRFETVPALVKALESVLKKAMPARTQGRAGRAPRARPGAVPTRRA
ncbi:MAG: NUDIX domain-containing protein [Thermoplasmatota archaeon]